MLLGQFPVHVDAAHLERAEGHGLRSHGKEADRHAEEKGQEGKESPQVRPADHSLCGDAVSYTHLDVYKRQGQIGRVQEAEDLRL